MGSNWAERIDTWIRRNPVVVVLVLGTLLISSIITISDGVGRAIDIYNEHVGWRDSEYEKLRSLHGGMNIQKVEEVLGSALFVRQPDGSAMTEKLFRGRDYWVQAVYDKVGVVKLLAITSCATDFRPAFDAPLGKVTLNESSFEVFNWRPNASRYFVSPATANSYFFDEYYGGNPGDYKTYFVGINDACPAVANYATSLAARGVLIESSAGETPGPDIATFRAKSIVNTFAETDLFTTGSDILAQFQIGVDRVLARTIDAEAGLCAVEQDPCPTMPPVRTPSPAN